MQTQEQLKNKNVKTENEVVVKVKELRKSFGDHTVINGISFDLHRKENITILGKSGTGKSVLIKSIVGLHEPDGGELVVLGKDFNQLEDEELNKMRRKIGYLFQGGALYDSMTVKQNLLFPIKRMGNNISKVEMDEAVENSLNEVGLIKAIDKTPAELSGGMKKRIALARTLIMRPEIVLYDEPTTGLDPVTSKEMSHLILKMQDKFNISSITITHDISCVKIIADKIYIIRDGKWGAEGTFDELSNSNDDWVRSFFH